MNSYEREYFVSRVRSGVYYIKLDGIKIKVLTPTIEDEFFANQTFMDVLDESRAADIFTEEEMWDWMKERGLWTDEQEIKIEGIQSDIEKLKTQMYENRKNEKVVEHARRYLRAAEQALKKMNDEKHEHFSKTCEGLAANQKAIALFERCCFVGGERLDTNEIDITSLFYNFNRMLLAEAQARELARNDPWRLNWIMKDQVKLFANEEGRELSPDQKSLLIWSQMYDNVQESMDCPPEAVINDDDLLDGWFIIQRKKQESEKAKSELEKKINSKIANSDEILVVADSKEQASEIHGMNSFHGDMVRKQRLATVRKKGTASDLDFQDRRLDIIQEQKQRFKETSRRR